MCDVWRVRNKNVKRYTFHQNHSTGFIQRRLDYFFISNELQESTIKADIIASFSTDHSPILFSIKFQDAPLRGKGTWKFNCSLLKNNEYVEKMKNHITLTLAKVEEENISNAHLKWEYLKYEIRKFTIYFSTNKAKYDFKENHIECRM
mgnify:CR=1 FL=1